MRRRRRLVPEVIQTSATDCGPAALKSLMAGFDLQVSYGRLREACQTDVDGTSISTMDEVANRLGLESEEIVIPRDHVLLGEAGALPAIVVVRHSNGETHFWVVWSVLGSLVQVMDPAVGRRWIHRSELMERLYVHDLPVPAAEWRAWACTEEFLQPLSRRLRDLGVAPDPLVAVALRDPEWTSLGALDAATRMVGAIVESRGLTRGTEAAAVVQRFAEASVAHLAGAQDAVPIPADYWSVRPSDPDEEGAAQVLLSGAVMMRGLGAGTVAREELTPELAAALTEPPPRPLRELAKLLRDDGLATPAVLAMIVALGAGIPVLEALIFRGLIDIGRVLGLPAERLTAVLALTVLMILGVGMKLPVAWSVTSLGRALEVRLRKAVYEKVPRLGDRYFRSRLVSDMAERSHSVHELRVIPELGEAFLSASARLIFTTAGIAWLDPSGAPLALLAAALVIALPLTFHPLLSEKALRVRAHLGGLSHFYLDALLGLAPIHAHGAHRTVRREHEALLVEWGRAALSLQRSAMLVEGFLTAAGFALGVGLILLHAEGGASGSTLLLIYWVLSLPALGTEVAVASRQYPALRSIVLRLVDPLNAPEAEPTAPHDAPSPTDSPTPSPSASTDSSERAGMNLRLEAVSVREAGLEILRDVSLEIPAGQHVGIVGPSGAGKSTLIGLMLGWYRPAHGTLEVDGRPLDGETLTRVRRDCAWVDPSVQLWGDSLLDNLRYGGPLNAPVGPVLEAGQLMEVLEHLPDGLQTELGEGGGLVSGGEGQRVRMGRALLRSGTRLALLDEPFRGLDRSERHRALEMARRWWGDATLLCVTHDVSETTSLDRVLIIEQGRVVEDGDPRALVADPSSRYRSLLDTESGVHEEMWSGVGWRRMHLDRGGLREEGPEDPRESGS